MKVLITGGGGFLGRLLGARLAAEGAAGLDGARTALSSLTLVDRDAPAGPAGAQCLAADLTAPGAAEAVLADRPDLIFHFAAVVSAEAEADLDLGLRVNLHATEALLRAAADAETPPVLVFASSAAVFSSPGGAAIDDATEPRPLSSYGAQKVMGELLVRDFSRRGLIRGRSLRFPTIVVRPGKANKAASGFASSILREPLAGQPAVLPVPETVRMHLLSPDGAIDAALHAAALPQAAFEGEPTVTLPGVSASVAEMLAALEAHAGPAARALVRAEPDAAVAAIVHTWPGAVAAPRAERLGFRADADFAEILARSLPHLGG